MRKTAEQGYKGKYANMSMPVGCLYLNNSGDKWVTQDMRFVLVMPDGTRKVRLAEYYYSFGNFAGIAYKFKGKIHFGLPKSFDGYETPNPKATGNDALQHVFHKDAR